MTPMAPQRPVGVLERKLAAALDGPAAPRAEEHLLAAVSGGPDSTALLAGLAALAPARGFRVTAAYVDHGLRGTEGAAECARVAALAGQLGVPFVSRTVAVPPGTGREARARHARYAALADMAAEVGAGRIATGHTQDDQAETLVFRLLRGAGRRGLGGMRSARGRLFRPMLDITRTDVRRFLADRGLGFAVDRTNADLALARNRIRRLVLPFLAAEFNPRLGASLATLALRLRDEDDFLAAAAAARAAGLASGDRLHVDVAAEPPALARRIVRAWLERGTRRNPSAPHVERVLALAAGRKRGALAVPGPARVLREGEYLVRRPGRAPTPRTVSVPIAPGATAVDPAGRWRLSLSVARPRRAGEAPSTDLRHALFDADVLPGPLVVRSPAPGDRLRVPGVGTRKLQDVLVDAKVPREARPGIAVLAAGGEVLWAAGVARGACAAIDTATRHVIEGVLEPAG
ncbi:MAG: tRNA lysidine(34) synthetase TilS [Deltaproteobacteria bacterium]|nr:MAG: tRNA lysidine(34) synthetase TilS [Deltaproteobacteria bacterium]